MAIATLSALTVLSTMTLGALAAFLPGRKVRVGPVTFESMCGNTALGSLRAGLLGD